VRRLAMELRTRPLSNFRCASHFRCFDPPVR
jgi:hypothetical protein